MDEAHLYKNLAAVSKMQNVAGIFQTESQKASDMYLKCQYLDELTDGHGIVFATGTPISNSMVELYTIAKGMVTYGMELMLALLEIAQGMLSSVIAATSEAITDNTLPESILTAVDECSLLPSIGVLAVSLIGMLVIVVLSFMLVITVYGRMFRLYLYTAISPVPLAAFAGEPSQSIGVSFLKSYAAVCLEGVVIALCCVIYSAYAAARPDVSADSSAAMQVLTYIGELTFNMLVLVGLMKGANQVTREMLGL